MKINKEAYDRLKDSDRILFKYKRFILLKGSSNIKIKDIIYNLINGITVILSVPVYLVMMILKQKYI